MADTSPGKVQALTAMFAQKNKPIMGIYHPGIKVRSSGTNRTILPSQDDSTSTLCGSTDEEFALPDAEISKTVSSLKMKVLPSVIKPKTELNATHNGKSKFDGISGDISKKSAQKPCIGPKPSLFQTSSSSSLQLNNTTASNRNTNGNCPLERTSEQLDSMNNDDNECLRIPGKSCTVGETIASFMFAGSASLIQVNNPLSSENKNNIDQLHIPVPTPRKSIKSSPTVSDTGFFTDTDIKENFRDPYSNIINSDNYICKNNVKFRRKKLPSKEKLGQPPLKPIKPLQMKLQSQYNGKVFQTCPVTSQRTSTLQPWNTLTSTPQKPMYSCPPRPSVSPPLRPPAFPLPGNGVLSESQSSCKNSILAVTEELYEDTLLNEKSERPVSLIPEYTEEEEQTEADAEELYDDAGDADQDAKHICFSQPTKPKNPPPPPPPCLEISVNDSSDELYQDALDLGNENEEFYEVMPIDYLASEEQDCPLYSNNRKELEKLRREEEKRVRRELKEREKKEKEKEKLKKKFGLTGEEIPIDAGLVKTDCRGSRNDLPVKRNETVLILRMEGNPSGKWLVKNERGKIGYVELTNIEVDPDSVKSVMSVRRTSVICEREELYCEAASEEEAIYEMTY